MKDKQLLEKNILALKHSISQTKATVFLSLTFTSWIAFFLGLRIYHNFVALIVASIIAITFLFKSFQFFEECENLQNQMKNLK